MKSTFKIGILTLCSVVFLTACQKDDGTILAKEKAYDTGSALVQISGSIPKTDLSLVDVWQYENYPVEVYVLETQSASGTDDGKFLITVVELFDDEWRFLDMSSRFSAVHQFTTEELSNYREECRELLAQKIYNASTEIFDDGNHSNQTSETEDFPCYLFDGERFECFETASGEDMVLLVSLYYSEDYNIPSAYKGELSDGVEFWFEPYATSSDRVIYQIDCADGTTAYLEHFPNLSEIVLRTDQGAEHEAMYAYSGTYIGLSDEIED